MEMAPAAAGDRIAVLGVRMNASEAVSAASRKESVRCMAERSRSPSARRPRLEDIDPADVRVQRGLPLATTTLRGTMPAMPTNRRSDAATRSRSPLRGYAACGVEEATTWKCAANWGERKAA